MPKNKLKIIKEKAIHGKALVAVFIVGVRTLECTESNRENSLMTGWGVASKVTCVWYGYDQQSNVVMVWT